MTSTSHSSTSCSNHTLLPLPVDEKGVRDGELVTLPVSADIGLARGVNKPVNDHGLGESFVAKPDDQDCEDAPAL